MLTGSSVAEMFINVNLFSLKHFNLTCKTVGPVWLDASLWNKLSGTEVSNNTPCSLDSTVAGSC